MSNLSGYKQKQYPFNALRLTFPRITPRLKQPMRQTLFLITLLSPLWLRAEVLEGLAEFPKPVELTAR